MGGGGGVRGVTGACGWAWKGSKGVHASMRVYNIVASVKPLCSYKSLAPLLFKLGLLLVLVAVGAPTSHAEWLLSA
jgi:hypothetical protein